MYTPREAEKMLGFPARTIRRYCRQFPEFLSQGVTKRGKHREFTEGDVYMLQRIRQLFQDGLSADQVRDALQAKPLARTDALPLIPAGLTDALSKIDDRMTSYDDRITKIETDHDARLAKLEDELAHERNERKRLELRWEKYRVEHARWKSLSWLQRRRTPEPQPPE